MSNAGPDSIDETLRKQFETSWTRGNPRPIEEFLPPDDSVQYLPTLEELVYIDLEFAWRHAGKAASTEVAAFEKAPRVEEYAARFSRLDQPEILLRLLEEEYRVRHRHGDKPGLAEYRNRFPDLVKTGRELEGTRGGHSTLPFPESGVPVPASFPDRYHMLAEYARGGFGSVWRARDSKLDRVVALKQLSKHLASQPDFRSRFVSEARITARLEHPGVVPVYDLGDIDEENSYYAMKLVRGETLAAAIDRFHALPADAGDRPVEERRLLNTFLMVCQTMEYSHARGVVHRDLKPRNIVLGDYGETIVLDWGLAKGTGEAESTDAGNDGVVSGDPALTRPGTVQGTPAYMAPEQAAGRTEEVGEVSDVYALGVILYQVLTGRIPFKGSTPEEVLEKVIEEDPPLPRSLDARIPAALEAICMKAMAREKSRRYQAVSLLTRDMQRFLADEPVSAFQEPLRIRLGRWMRRHRMLVTGVGAATLVALLGLGVISAVLAVSNTRLEEANTRERTARAEAEQQKARAEQERNRAKEHFHMARDAVDRYYTRVARNPKLRSKGMEDLRKTLLLEASQFYEKFTAQKIDDPLLGLYRGWAFIHLGHITAEIDSTEKAVALFTRARDHFMALAAAHPGDPHYRLQLGKCHHRIAGTLLEMRKHEEAEKHFKEALEICERIHREYPDTPSVAGAESDRVFILGGLATLYKDTGRLQEGEAMYLASVNVQKRLVKEQPDNPHLRFGLASTTINLAGILGRSGRLPEAVEECEKAVLICRKLVSEVPDEPKYMELLATGQNHLGMYHGNGGHRKKASAAFKESMAIRKKLVDLHPGVPRYLARLASSRCNLGTVYMGQKQYPKALAELEEAKELREMLMTRQPDLPEHRIKLAGVLINKGRIHSITGRIEGAFKAYGQAETICEALVSRFPAETNFARYLAYACIGLGQTYGHRGDWGEAVSRYTRAIEKCEEILRNAPGQPAIRGMLLVAVKSRAEFLDKLDKHEAAVSDWRRALDLESRKKNASPGAMAVIRFSLACSLGKTGDHRSAVATAMELEEKSETTPFIQVALLYSIASHAVRRDAALKEQEQIRRSGDYGELAVRYLDQARAKGMFRDASNVKKLDRFLPWLEGRQDFITFLEQVRGR